MSRRDQTRTDNSTTSWASSFIDNANTAWAYVEGSLLFYPSAALLDAKFFLHRMLSQTSGKSYISTTSSTAYQSQEAAEDAVLQKFRCIGQGQCGTVWALLGTTAVIKIPNKPSDVDRLWEDAYNHKKVEEAFQKVPYSLRKDLCVPKYNEWIRPVDTTSFWDKYLSLFPQALDLTYGLVSERIHPLPAPLREAIFNALCPRHLLSKKQEILMDQKNKSCLVRLYLGRRDSQKRAASKTFSLYNFELLVNEMEDLELDVEKYAVIMADALSIMHWGAHLDANDVEFVLGSTPRTKPGRLASEMCKEGKDSEGVVGSDRDFTKRSVHMWLLDFNMCKSFKKDKAGLELLTRGFWFNDPYYPRPVSTDPRDVKLWKVFRDRYIKTSAAMGEGALATSFIETIVAMGKERQQKIMRQGKGSLFGEVMK